MNLTLTGSAVDSSPRRTVAGSLFVDVGPATASALMPALQGVLDSAAAVSRVRFRKRGEAVVGTFTADDDAELASVVQSLRDVASRHRVSSATLMLDHMRRQPVDVELVPAAR